MRGCLQLRLMIIGGYDGDRLHLAEQFRPADTGFDKRIEQSRKSPLVPDLDGKIKVVAFCSVGGKD